MTGRVSTTPSSTGPTSPKPWSAGCSTGCSSPMCSAPTTSSTPTLRPPCAPGRRCRSTTLSCWCQPWPRSPRTSDSASPPAPPMSTPTRSPAGWEPWTTSPAAAWGGTWSPATCPRLRRTWARTTRWSTTPATTTPMSTWRWSISCWRAPGRTTPSSPIRPPGYSPTRPKCTESNTTASTSRLRASASSNPPRSAPRSFIRLVPPHGGAPSPASTPRRCSSTRPPRSWRPNRSGASAKPPPMPGETPTVCGSSRCRPWSPARTTPPPRPSTTTSPSTWTPRAPWC